MTMEGTSTSNQDSLTEATLMTKKDINYILQWILQAMQLQLGTTNTTTSNKPARGTKSSQSKCATKGLASGPTTEPVHEAPTATRNMHTNTIDT